MDLKAYLEWKKLMEAQYGIIIYAKVEQVTR